MLSFIFSKFQY